MDATCHACGAPVPHGAGYCPGCGARLEARQIGDVGARVRGPWRRWSSPAGDVPAAQTHPLTLRFASPELEAAFKDEYDRCHWDYSPFLLILLLPNRTLLN
jgi:hypothetical protein